MSANAVLTEQEIRIFLMDKPQLNTLLEGVRWDAQDIDQAQIMCVDCYNSMMPPLPSGYTVESFPWRYIMLMFVAGHLLKSAAVQQASNQLTYSADGITVDDNNKAPIFTELGQTYTAEAKELMKNIRIAENISGAYGVKHSEFIRMPTW